MIRDKNFYTLCFILFLAQGILKAQMQDIEVSGAGSAVVNGTYTYKGQHTDFRGQTADYYQKGSVFIYRLSFQDFPWDPISYWWRISTALGSNSGSNIYYSGRGSTQTHPVGITFSFTSSLGTSPGPNVALSVNSWNGTSWSTGSAPAASDNVILSSSTSPGSFNAANVTLNDGINLNVASGNTITISGDLSGQPRSAGSDATLNNFALSGTASNWVSGAGSTFAGTGTPANGLNFDGTDDYASVNDGSAFDFSSGFTAEAWVKADALSNHASLVSKFANNNREFSILLLSSGVIEYSISFNGSTEQYFSGSTTLSAGTWYHIALTYDSSTMKAYLNGVADGTNSVSGTIYNGTSELYIGARSEGSLSRFFDGTVDEVRIWNTARSQAEIQAGMNIELSGNETGLVAYYNFNQGTAGGSNSGETTLDNTKVVPYTPNVISGSGTLIFDNSGETLSLSNVKLNMEGVVQVTSGTTLQTNDSLTLTASSASSYGQIIGDGTVLGNVASQAWMDVSSARYHYLGSPFSDATLAEFNEGQTMVAANSSQGTVWQWNATNAAWEAPSALSDVAANGKGYAMYAGTNSYGTFLLNGNGVSELDGTVASGDVAVALGYNDGQSASVGFAGGSSQGATEGWNFLANPYPSQYDWNGQSLPSGMSNAFYVNKGGAYASYVSGVGTNGGTRYLAPFQGFWVQTSNSSPGNFTFEQDQRVTNPSTSLMKTSAVDGVWLSVSDAAASDELFIGFDNQATSGFDTNLDARKLLNKNDIPNLYTNHYGDAFSINRVAPATQTAFPLTLDNVTDGRQLSFNLKSDQLNSYSSIILEDKMLNVMYDLKASDYSFVHSESYGPNRFVVHFYLLAVGKEELPVLQDWYAYATEKGIEVQLGNLQDVSIEMYDLSGNILFQLEHQEGVASLPINRTRQLYVVKVISSSASSVQKIIR